LCEFLLQLLNFDKGKRKRCAKSGTYVSLMLKGAALLHPHTIAAEVMLS
jgi:hypothetical protein